MYNFYIKISFFITKLRSRPEPNLPDLNPEVQVKVWGLPGPDLEVSVQVLVESG